MAILDILLYPDKALTVECEEVKEIDQETLKFLDDLAETMYFAEGVGLAAPQVGVTKQITVIDVEPQNQGSSLIELINPKIIEHQGKQLKRSEGCLSFPKIYEPVSRYERVVVEALNRKGEVFTIEADGLLAVALQHEIDHLKGILFIDYLGSFRQSMIKRKMKKLKKR